MKKTSTDKDTILAVKKGLTVYKPELYSIVQKITPESLDSIVRLYKKAERRRMIDNQVYLNKAFNMQGVYEL